MTSMKRLRAVPYEARVGDELLGRDARDGDGALDDGLDDLADRAVDGDGHDAPVAQLVHTLISQ